MLVSYTCVSKMLFWQHNYVKKIHVRSNMTLDISCLFSFLDLKEMLKMCKHSCYNLTHGKRKIQSEGELRTKPFFLSLDIGLSFFFSFIYLFIYFYGENNNHLRLQYARHKTKKLGNLSKLHLEMWWCVSWWVSFL